MHDVDRYAHAVRSGDIRAGKWVRLACDRHVHDRKRKDLEFLPGMADSAFDFFSHLKHSKGEWAGSTFELELWQQFIVGSLFGWYYKNPRIRRFRIAYISVARKNGKSTLAAGIGLFLFFMDGEPGAEVYTAATKRDQARISHSEATRMVKKSPLLKPRIGIFKDNLHIVDTASKFEPLGADADSMDGLNVHGAIVDELHAHKKRDVWDVLETATGSRREPMQVAITTAGHDQSGICFEQHLYVEKILEGFKKGFDDDSYFGIIYDIDKPVKRGERTVKKGDDWRDPKNWIKANPNLGVSVKKDDLERKAKKAKAIPAAQNNFLRKHMNRWTQQVDRWIDLDLWDENQKGKIIESQFTGRMCVGGIDLSAVSDLTCWLMAFPSSGDPIQLDLILRAWCPEARVHDKRNRYADQYQAWVKQGFLVETEGEAMDYDLVRAAIVEDAVKYKIDSIAVDRLFQGYEFTQKLDKQLGGNEKRPKVFACGMGYLSMAGPCKELEERLLKRKINHGGNPVLRFCADNVAVSMDPAGNRKPNKAQSQGKIDGIVALLLCLDRLLREKPKGKVKMPVSI